MAFPTTKNQIPDHSILDANNKQTYLGNQYNVSLAATIGASETPILLLSNTSTALALFLSAVKVASLTATQNVILRVYMNPTVSGAGTIVATQSLRPGLPNNSVGVITKNPTVSANGVLVDMLAASAFSTNISSLLSILDTANSVLVTATASAASTSTETTLTWYEL